MHSFSHPFFLLPLHIPHVFPRDGQIPLRSAAGGGNPQFPPIAGVLGVAGGRRKSVPPSPAPNIPPPTPQKLLPSIEFALLQLYWSVRRTAREETLTPGGTVPHGNTGTPQSGRKKNRKNEQTNQSYHNFSALKAKAEATYPDEYRQATQKYTFDDDEY